MNVLKATPLVLCLVLLASACASSHHASSPPMTETVPSTPGPNLVPAILRVQSSFWGKGLTIFPNHPTRTACRIPGVLGFGIAGTCQTRVTNEPNTATTVVIFTEYWPAQRFRTHGPPKGILHHSWRFAVKPGSHGRLGRVIRLGGGGAFPPQASD
jgi:hypothetical protein